MKNFLRHLETNLLKRKCPLIIDDRPKLKNTTNSFKYDKVTNFAVCFNKINGDYL